MVAQPRAATVMGLLEEARYARLRGFKVAQKNGSVKTAFGRLQGLHRGELLMNTKTSPLRVAGACRTTTPLQRAMATNRATLSSFTVPTTNLFINKLATAYQGVRTWLSK